MKNVKIFNVMFEQKWVIVGHAIESFLNWIKRFLQEINRSMSAVLPMVHLPRDLLGLLSGFIPRAIIFALLLFEHVFSSIFGVSRGGV